MTGDCENWSAKMDPTKPSVFDGCPKVDVGGRKLRRMHAAVCDVS